MTTQPAGPVGGDGESTPPSGSFAGLVLAIYHDLIANAIHEVVHEAHRAEKLLRTQQVQLANAAEAAKAAAATATSTADGQQLEKPPEPKLPVSNPMTVLPKEFICPKCKLPRHTPETMANGTVGGKEDKKKYCSKLPFQNRPLHDIYGNPFPSVSTSAKEKKAKAAAAAAAAENGGDSAVEGGGDTPAVLTSNGKKSDPSVYVKCTNCQTEKIHAPRFAAHLEKCLGIAGRKSSRAAMAKIGGNGTGSGAGSPALAADSIVGAGTAWSGKGSGKATPDTGEVETFKKEKEKLTSFTVAEDGGINVPPPPAPTATGKVPGTLPKKKKKTGLKDSGAPQPEDVPPPPKDVPRPASPIVVAAPLPIKDGKDTPASNKKRKRKSDIAGVGDTVAVAAPTTTKAEPPAPAPVATDDKESITVTPTKPKPPLKKQKTEGTPMDGGLLKKNPISKFKDRDSPGPTPLKKADVKRESNLSSISSTTGGKFPPGRNAISSPPPPQTKASSPIPSKHPPSASPKQSPAKLVTAKAAGGTRKSSGDVAMRKVKSSQGVSTSMNGVSATPKIAKKTLPSSNGSLGVNVPAPSKIAGKTLPKPVLPLEAAVPTPVPNNSIKKDGSVEKMRKQISNGSVKAGGGTGMSKPKLQKAGLLGGGGGSGSGSGGIGGDRVKIGGKTIPGKTLPGKRAVPAPGFGGAGERDTDGGIPRKRPKVGE